MLKAIPILYCYTLILYFIAHRNRTTFDLRLTEMFLLALPQNNVAFVCLAEEASIVGSPGAVLPAHWCEHERQKHRNITLHTHG